MKFHLHNYKTVGVDEDGFANHTTHHTYLLQECMRSSCIDRRIVTLRGHWKRYLSKKVDVKS